MHTHTRVRALLNHRWTFVRQYITSETSAPSEYKCRSWALQVLPTVSYGLYNNLLS